VEPGAAPDTSGIDMDAATAHAAAPRRGARLLIAHCESLGEQRQPAVTRLAAIIGDELAERLVTALGRSHPPRFGGLGA
jgi:hypothetical protein